MWFILFLGGSFRSVRSEAVYIDRFQLLVDLPSHCLPFEFFTLSLLELYSVEFP